MNRENERQQGRPPIDRLLKLLVRFSTHLKNSLHEIRFPGLAVLMYRNVAFGILPVPGVGFVRIPSVYEREVTKEWKPQTGSVVVDVGSYMGKYSILASRVASKVLAIEAHPGNFELLRRNVRLTKSHRVIPINAIITDHDGIDRLYESDHASTHSVLPRGRGKSEVVACYRLDSLLERLGVTQVDWVKIDVEGADLKVLRGMTQTLRDSATLRMVIELDYDEGGVASDFDAIIEVLRSSGFAIQPLGFDSQGRARHILARKHSTPPG